MVTTDTLAHLPIKMDSQITLKLASKVDPVFLIWILLQLVEVDLNEVETGRDFHRFKKFRIREVRLFRGINLLWVALKAKQDAKVHPLV